MGLLKFFIRNDLRHARSRTGVRVRVIGERDNLQPDIVALLEEAENRTRYNDQLDLIIAFNYGSRAGNRRAAARGLARESPPDGCAPEDIDETMFAAAIADGFGAGPDLIIRTSGRDAPVQFPDVAVGL